MKKIFLFIFIFSISNAEEEKVRVAQYKHIDASPLYLAQTNRGQGEVRLSEIILSMKQVLF